MRNIVAAFLLAALVIPAQLVLADGMFMPPQMSARVAGDAGVASTAQKGLIIDLLNDREVLLLQTTYQGPSEDFAWVIPVPGRPGKEDVFSASTDLLDVAFGQSAPRVKTTIHDPLEAEYGGMAGGFPPSAPPPPGVEGLAEAPSVTVHERFEMGKYDVAVLSATGTQVLVDWLRENGYQVPENTQDTLGIYVDKSWYFVALRILPAEATKDPIIEDVEPIGIRFATEQLVYPLTISRASSRQKTEILLVVLSEAPVVCDQLKDVQLPLDVQHPEGSSYATIRRQALETQGPGCVVEYRGGQAVPYEDLHYKEDGKWPRGRSPLTELKGSRFWTLLDKQDMEDLTFAADRGADEYQLSIQRQGTVHYPAIKLILHQPGARIALLALLCITCSLISYWLLRRGFSMTPAKITGLLILSTVALCLSSFESLIVGLIALLMVAFLLGRLRSRAIEPHEREELAKLLPVAQFLRWVIILAGFVVLGVVALATIAWYNWDFLPHYESILLWFFVDEWTAEPFALAAALVQVGWCALTIPTLLAYLSGTSRSLKACFAAIATVIPVLVLVVSGRDALSAIVPFDVVWLSIRSLLVAVIADLPLAVFSVLAAIATWAAFGLLCSLLILGPYMSPKARAATQLVVVTLFLLTAAAVVAQLPRHVISAAYAGTIGGHSAAHDKLYGPLTQIDRALETFLEHAGCFPGKLKDLLAETPPAYGVDSSGNPVQLTGQYRGPYLEQLPKDPLTGRRDTWIYEPTATPMVDSGGYTVVIKKAKPQYKEMREGHPDERPLLYYQQSESAEEPDAPF